MHTRDLTGTKTRSSYLLSALLFLVGLLLPHLLVVVGAHEEGPRHDFGSDPDGDLPSSSSSSFFFVDGDDVEAFDSSKVEALSGFGEDTLIASPSNRGLAGTTRCRNGTLKQLLSDPGFERTVPLGPLPNPTGIWAVSRSTKEAKVDGVRTTAADAAAFPRKFGNRQLLLSIPDTYTAISSRAAIRTALWTANRTDVVYEVTADVKWVNYQPNGTAVLSLWTALPPSGGWAGVDYWISKSTWVTYRYRFLNPSAVPLAPQNSPWLLLALYAPQSPKVTTIRVDNVKVWEVCRVGLPGTTGPPNPEEKLTAGTFDAAPLGPVGDDDPVYHVTHKSPSTTVTATIVQDENNATNRQLRMVLPSGSSNYEYKAVGQVVNLTFGVRYKVSVDVRRNSNATHRGIINYRMKCLDTGVWLGPVDLFPANDNLWHTYTYVVGIPEPGRYLVNVQLFGFGNYGNELDVTFDNFSCRQV